MDAILDGVDSIVPKIALAVNLGETVLNFVTDVYQVCVIMLVECVITQLAVNMVIDTLNTATYPVTIGSLVEIVKKYVIV